MKRLSIFTSLAIALPLVPAALDGKAIITEWTGAFHTMDLAHFADWPGVDGNMPIDVSATADRVWLIWPHTIISLSARGMPDAASLLSLFSSQTASWNGAGWTPENGILSSRGDWLGYLEGRVYRLDLLSARTRSGDWKEGPAKSLFAAPNGNLVALTGKGAYYVNFSENVSASVLDFNVPPILAVSTREPELAWLDAEGIHLVSIRDGSEEIIPIPAGGLPAGSPWGASWFGDSLVLAYPGALYAVNLSVAGPPLISRFEARGLSRRWYRIRGNENALLIHTPETRKLWIYGAEEEANTVALPAYRDFLAEHAKPAGRLLEEVKEFGAAVRYYNWVLPQIRFFRSRYPLEEVWAELEHELVERRLDLLQVDQSFFKVD